jgi:hypothetical protein
MTKFVIRIEPVGCRFAYRGYVKQGRKVVAETRLCPTRESAQRAAEVLNETL